MFLMGAAPSLLTSTIESMGTLSDRFGALLEQMKESDRRLQELIEKHLDDTQEHLNELRRISEDV